MPAKRVFTIQASEIGFTGGDYKSDIPSKAAKKAGRRIFKEIKESNAYKQYASHDSIKFILREKTLDSDKKTFFYEASMKNLAKPKYIEIHSPNNANADKNGIVKYAVTKEIKIATCSENHVNHLL